MRQRRDHERLDGLLEQLRAADGTDQDRALASVCRLVFTHAFAEEAVLWPALRRALPDGDQLTVRVEREHQKITEVVAELEQSRPGTAERHALIERATTLLREDAHDEEDELFPRLQAVLNNDELRRLGRQLGIVRRVAPTRSHP